MPLKQVSVFLDNRPGSLSEVISHLDRNKIRIFALSIADAGEYGLVRMITEDPDRAVKILEDADFNLAKSKKNVEVMAILVTEKDTISKITQLLSKSGLNIEYAYSSAVHTDGKIALILRASDVEKAEKVLKENDIATLTLTEIEQHFR
ncbi:MAG: acetolactate synthase [Candidatus Bathyarchaeia archaeon]